MENLNQKHIEAVIELITKRPPPKGGGFFSG
jgi:hypothetical protein